ncbi:MAG: FdhF/YdeP family oxidoreductase [Gammaproteobacteria bacterium]
MASDAPDSQESESRSSVTGIETPDSAAGIPAVVEVARQIATKTGIGTGIKGLLKMNQPDGFDCPGCAWPEAESPKKIEFCENGAKAFADEATRKHIAPEFFKQHSLTELATKSGRWLNDQGRLTRPMLKKAGKDHYEPATWFSAYSIIARELDKLVSPDEAAFYTSGRTSNEAAYLWQLMVRVFGTNNMPDCSNMCHESSGTALSEVIGSGKGTVRLRDFDEADAIFIFGQNPGSNHPRMLATLQQAKQNGASIVSVNPLNETGLRSFSNPQTIKGLMGKGDDLSDLHVPVRINGDVAFLKGLCRAMLEAESSKAGSVIDREFVKNHTVGFKEFLVDINNTGWEEIVAGSGVTEATIRQAAQIAVQSKATICCWAMGMTQHKNAVANIQEIVNFLLLQGNFGRPGAGACPVRGHSNVQGDRTMGIWEKPPEDFLAKLGERYSFDTPKSHGYDTVNTIRAMAHGDVKVLIALGGNFMAATPDSKFTEQAVRNCKLTVQLSTKLNRSHVITGETALILPVLGRTEVDHQGIEDQFVTVENSMGLVTRSAGVLKPASQHLKSEVRAIAELADMLVGAKAKVKWLDLADDYYLIRDEIEKVIPGFEEFNDKLIEEGSLELPHAVRDELRFDNAAGKAVFTVHPIKPLQIREGRFLMMTVRSHDQFNTTVYTDNDRYRGVKQRMVVFMHPEDIAKSGLSEGHSVTITSHHGDAERSMEGFRVVPYDIPLGCVATYYPEANPLIPVRHVADGSNTPAYKSVVVSVK